MPILTALAVRLNDWFVASSGGAERPRFLDIDRLYPALRQVDAAYPEIRAEAEAVLARPEGLPSYDEVDPAQHCIVSTTPGRWTVHYLCAMGEWSAPNCASCPRTVEVLRRVPGLFQAQFSYLDPGKSVPAHRGPFSGYLRYHLGLVVPDVDPPRLRVGEEVRPWRAGEGFLFDDHFEHEVINSSPQGRLVLIVDVLRPLPLVQRTVNKALVPLLHRLYGRHVLQRSGAHPGLPPGPG